jgi:hypothetical protein
VTAPPAAAPAADGVAAGPRWTLAGGTLRGLLALAGIALWAVVFTGTALEPGAVLLALVAAGIVTSVRHPGSPAPVLLCGGALAAHVLFGPTVPATLAATASLLHTTHVLAAAAEFVPRHAPVETAVAWPVLRRWAITQTIAVPTVAAVAFLLA